MTKTVSISRIELIREQTPKQRVRKPSVSQKVTHAIGYRKLHAEDVPWVQSWSVQLRLPNNGNARLRGFILTEHENKVGYIAVRSTNFNTGRTREPVMWIVSAFLIPSHRRRGLLPRFCELMSPYEFPKGKAAVRIAADNHRMHRFTQKGGWRKVRTTSRYTDYVLELNKPFTTIGR